MEAVENNTSRSLLDLTCAWNIDRLKKTVAFVIKALECRVYIDALSYVCPNDFSPPFAYNIALPLVYLSFHLIRDVRARQTPELTV